MKGRPGTNAEVFVEDPDILHRDVPRARRGGTKHASENARAGEMQAGRRGLALALARILEKLWAERGPRGGAGGVYAPPPGAAETWTG